MTLRGFDLTVNKVTLPNVNDKFNFLSGALDETANTLDSLEARIAAAETQLASILAGIDAALIISGQLALARGGTHADLSATGGTGQILKQKTAGGNIAVETIAASELSNGVSGSGKVLLQNAPQTTGNTALGGVGSFGGGSVVVFVADTTAGPGSNPAGGGIIYSNAGALTWRGSGGTVTVIAPA